VASIADRPLTAADLRGPLITDGVQRWETRNGPTWMVRTGRRLLDWAEMTPGAAAHLDHMLAVGDVVLDGDPAEVGIQCARYTMAYDQRHADVTRLARRGRLYSADGINYFTGPFDGPATMLDDDLIEAVGDLIHHGYLFETGRPGPDGTTVVEARLNGLTALNGWKES
jgi:hypothetical protein